MSDRFARLITRLKGETFLFLALVLLAVPGGASAQGAPYRAGVIIRFDDASTVARCVTFNEPSLTGIELLTRAGFSLRVDTNSSIGAGVCKINSQGCDAGRSCFCQCEGSTCAYWQYFHLQNGAWKYSVLGAGVYQLSDGAVEGWAWGNNVVPPVMSLDQICASAPAVSGPTGAPQSTIVPTRVPTFTPQPATPTAAPTAVPVVVTASPVSSPTSLPAIVTPSATAPLIASPTVPSPTVTPTLPPPQTAGVSSPVVSYIVFGVIVLGLGAWLVIQARRKVR